MMIETTGLYSLVYFELGSCSQGCKKARASVPFIPSMGVFLMDFGGIWCTVEICWCYKPHTCKGENSQAISFSFLID